jgi:hypothetical protein
MCELDDVLCECFNFCRKTKKIFMVSILIYNKYLKVNMQKSQKINNNNEKKFN